MPLGLAAPSKFRDELIATANAIAAPGKGILAADESVGTIGELVSPISHVASNRSQARDLLPSMSKMSKKIVVSIVNFSSLPVLN